MNDLYDFIKQKEGLRLKPYRDKFGNWTVFYGRNISAVATTTEEILFLLQHGNTKEVANLFLDNDINVAQKACKKIFNKFDDYSELRQIVLISVMFNLGSKRFSKFQRMIKAIKANKWDLAAVELLDSVRARIQLPNRSNEEAQMLRRG